MVVPSSCRSHTGTQLRSPLFLLLVWAGEQFSFGKREYICSCLGERESLLTVWKRSLVVIVARLLLQILVVLEQQYTCSTVCSRRSSSSTWRVDKKATFLLWYRYYCKYMCLYSIYIPTVLVSSSSPVAAKTSLLNLMDKNCSSCTTTSSSCCCNVY